MKTATTAPVVISPSITLAHGRIGQENEYYELLITRDGERHPWAGVLVQHTGDQDDADGYWVIYDLRYSRGRFLGPHVLINSKGPVEAMLAIAKERAEELSAGRLLPLWEMPFNGRAHRETIASYTARVTPAFVFQAIGDIPKEGETLEDMIPKNASPVALDLRGQSNN